jgi:hypothetical protein
MFFNYFTSTTDQKYYYAFGAEVGGCGVRRFTSLLAFTLDHISVVLVIGL